MTYAQLIADALITNAMELTALGKAKNTLTSKAVVNTQLNTLARDIANRTEGNPTQPVRDVTDDIDSRSEQELHFYLEHHHWPEEPCNCGQVLADVSNMAKPLK